MILGVRSSDYQICSPVNRFEGPSVLPLLSSSKNLEPVLHTGGETKVGPQTGGGNPRIRIWT